MSDVRYRPEIDGLRALAVAVVVLFHASPTLMPGGFVGVDVFFVISGYLITAILLQEHRATGRISLVAFYARRMRRLLPALLVVLAATVVVGAIVLSRVGRFQAFAESALAAAAFVANFHFQWNTGGYFDDAAHRQPLLHLWSLAVEEQFYLVYPLLLIASLRWMPSRIVAVLVALSVVSFVLAEYWLGVYPEAAFYQMPARFWELAIGAVVAFGPPDRLRRLRAVWQATAGLATIVASSWLLHEGARFPGAAAVPPVAGAALVLHAIHGSRHLGAVGRLLSWRPVVGLGLVSYPLYLWHWPLLALDGASRLEPAGVGWRLSLCAAATALAWLTFRFVETPVRSRRHFPPTGVLRVGVLATGLVMVGILGATTLPLAPAGAALALDARTDRPDDIGACHFDANARISALASPKCASSSAAVRVAIWGDSHALAWKPLAWDLAGAAGVAAEPHTMDACPPVPRFEGTILGAPEFAENCTAFNALVLERVRADRYDTIVIAARWPAHLGLPMWSAEEVRRRSAATGAEGSPERVAAGVRDAIATASRHAERVIVIGPTPVMRYDAPDCLATERASECSIARKDFELAVAGAWRMLLDAAAGRPNVLLVDPTPFFCPDAQCPPLRDGYGLFWDDDHVSSTAAHAFSQDLQDHPERYVRSAPPAGTPASSSP